MKKLIIAILLLSTPAYSAPVFNWPPPTRYAQPFKGRVLVYPLSSWDIISRCGMAYACTPIGGDRPSRMKTVKTCSIVVMKVGSSVFGKVIDKQSYNNLVRHEKGHCNGWPANHPE